MVVSSLPDERRAAVAAQLEERYAATYEVVPVATSSQAADALRTASNDGRQVAILLADDPGELDDGLTVFQVAARLFPTSAAACSWNGVPGETVTLQTWC